MAAAGGPIESISLDGRSFSVAADAEVQRKLGGMENESQPNGDGTSRLIQSRVSPAFMGLVVEVDDSRGDHEYLQDLADRPDFFAVAVTYSSGKVYQGRGQISGELQFSNLSTTAAFDVVGTGKFTPQQ